MIYCYVMWFVDMVVEQLVNNGNMEFGTRVTIHIHETRQKKLVLCHHFIISFISS